MKWAVIGSDNGLLFVQCQTIIWTIADPWEQTSAKLKSKYMSFSHKMHFTHNFGNAACKMAAIIYQHQCVNSLLPGSKLIYVEISIEYFFVLFSVFSNESIWILWKFFHIEKVIFCGVLLLTHHGLVLHVSILKQLIFA